MIDPELLRWLARALGTDAVEPGPRIQRLWGGYGELRRYFCTNGAARVVVKHVLPPRPPSTPTARRSHERKLRSYAVEAAFYQNYAPRCPVSCRVPLAYAFAETTQGYSLVLEDLEVSGYGPAPAVPTIAQISACVSWLAHFHATFMGVSAPDLWRVGTYWHLATRPDELRELRHLQLRAAAARIDVHLRSAAFQCLVHGDAKSDNFCLAETNEVAAVDFQYVGQGPGVKDLVYFLSSCLGDADLETRSDNIIDHYFEQLDGALQSQPRPWPAPTRRQLEQEWRDLVPWAWADLYRFLLGWAPGQFAPRGPGWRSTMELLDSWRQDPQTAEP